MHVKLYRLPLLVYAACMLRSNVICCSVSVRARVCMRMCEYAQRIILVCRLWYWSGLEKSIKQRIGRGGEKICAAIEDWKHKKSGFVIPVLAKDFISTSKNFLPRIHYPSEKTWCKRSENRCPFLYTYFRSEAYIGISRLYYQRNLYPFTKSEVCLVWKP